MVCHSSASSMPCFNKLKKPGWVYALQLLPAPYSHSAQDEARCCIMMLAFYLMPLLFATETSFFFCFCFCCLKIALIKDHQYLASALLLDSHTVFPQLRSHNTYTLPAFFFPFTTRAAEADRPANIDFQLSSFER